MVVKSRDLAEARKHLKALRDEFRYQFMFVMIDARGLRSRRARCKEIAKEICEIRQRLADARKKKSPKEGRNLKSESHSSAGE